MSKTIISLLSLTLLFLGTYSANAFESNLKKHYKLKTLEESSKPLNHELIVFPLSFAVSGFELGGEFVTKERRTIRFSAGYFISNSANAYNSFGNTENFFETMEGFRTEAQYRFYSRDFEAKDNFYLGLFGVFKSVTLQGEKQVFNPINGSTTNTPITLESSALSLGLLLGYRVRLHDVFSMDFHFGGGITPTSIGDAEEAHINQVNPYKKSINVRAGMTFGIRI